ncbi:undecaprenyl-phosphate glucose phosphotransferase [Adhaeribacter aquaticus]|uniref:undecaprenyl-phosphate glucose phosphotransferase n=1 Tax=Adhaeribacter aquaticus TaxID=299567 RepID=UPI000428A56D|nr:undecaprenyl-phosphate glucose phosphotransferase [Adhaeribacter aquaticus]
MPAQNEKYIKIINTLGDLALLNLAAFASNFTRFGNTEHYKYPNYLNLIIYFNLAWIVSASILNIYNIKRTTRITYIVSNLIKHIVLFILIIEASLNITQEYSISRTYLTHTYLLMVLFMTLWRIGLTFLLQHHRIRGGNYKKVVIVGFNKASNQLRKYFENNPEYGYRYLGFFDDNTRNNSKFLGSISAVQSFVKEYEVDEIYCSAFNLTSTQVTQLIDFAEDNFVRLKFIPESNLIQSRKLSVDFYDLLPVMNLRPIPLDDVFNKFAKRSFDIVFSSLVILFLLSWVIPLIGIIIKIDSPGPIFFRQMRNGRNNKAFACFKFRSMYINDDADTKQATKGDGRITKIGAFLRKSSLDELPQFFNVLIGDMSVVGPRPHPIKLNENYRRIIDRYMSRHLIKPGVTGLAQVMGYRGETSEPHQMKNRIKFDVFYVENWTFLFDIKIILITIFNAFKGDKNAY